MMFDKIAIALISPLGSALVLGALALLLAFGRRRRWALRAGVLALLWLWVWSLPVVSHSLRGALEAAYPEIEIAALPTAPAIVVLGGAVSPPERADGVPDLNEAADRVWHAARLYHAGKARLLLLSGGSNREVSATSEADAMRVLLRDLGVADADMLLEEDSRNTRQNARFSAELLRARGIDRILLVTSALHMQRAVRLFAAEGLTVIPAPIDHEARTRFTAVDWLPSTDALDGSVRAMKELVGRAMGR
ncbi:YdcF family protein [Rhodocyclus purpureus]|uniref:YdcF family protein n=1 Tax=Rhodocyclus purpureus TaxID=1067 RepID=UPI0019134654|nr:YdcF family protein [Rhodocyclus purpureus]MBK5914657.1 hypothetical protein [Rhodocyclus purpureus]